MLTITAGQTKEEGICNDFPHNKILSTPGFVFIGNDFIDGAE
jgi:hypothetical protein